MFSGDETGKIIVHDYLNPPEEKFAIQISEEKTSEAENKSANEIGENPENLENPEELSNNKAKKPKLNEIDD